MKIAVSDLVNASINGQSSYATWRKTASQITTAGIWFDLSLSPGNPAPQYYASAPLVAVQMLYSDQGGINGGQSVSPFTKYLRRFLCLSVAATPLPMPMILCDYLLYYPFIDEGTTDAQPMTNSVSLPRYTTGAGVQIMAVSVAGRTGGQTFQVTYQNQSGVSGRVTSVVIQNTAAANGSIVSSATATNLSAGPFLPLQSGDTGVRQIESVQMISGTDVGLFTLVLVKPLLTTQIIGIDAAVEVDPLLTQMVCPQIQDNAYLNLLCLPNGSMSGVALHGEIETVWI